MKKIVTFLLALGLLGTALVGCGNTEQPPEVVEKDPVTHIQITTEADPHERITSLATTLEQYLSNLGYTVTVVEDNGIPAAEEVCEILLGSVNRAPTTTLTQQLGDCGYGSRVEGNKLYLAASCPALVQMAFEDLPAQAFCDRTNPFGIIDGQTKVFDSFVYLIRDGVSDIDFVVQTEDEAFSEIASMFQMKLANHTRNSVDKLVGGSKKLELIKLEASDGFDYNTYAIRGSQDGVRVYAVGLEAMQKAVDDLYAMLVGISSFKTSKHLYFPAETLTVRVSYDVPVLPFESGAGQYTANVNGSYTLTWENATLQTMESYAARLSSLGYTQTDSRETTYEWTKSDDYYVEGKTYTNTFRTYSNGLYDVYMYFLEGTQSVRISATTIAEKKALAALEAEGATTGSETPSFTLLNIGGESEDGIDFMTHSGMCFAFKLSDGRFIMVDGGEWRDADTNASDVTRLYNWLKENSNNGEIVIAAWFLTHHHSDHVNVAWKFEQMYGNDVTIQRFMYSFPSMDYALTAPESDVNKPYYDKVFPRTMSMLSKYECIVPRTGRVFKIGDAEIEVLYTHDDFYPNPLKDYNNSSTTVRITLGGKSFLIAGDLEEPGQLIACRQNGTRLDSDYVQSTHHSWNGLELFFRYGIGTDGNSSAIWPLNHGVRWPKVEQDGIEYNNTYYRTLAANNWLYENSVNDYFAYHGIQTIPLG
ncbi:MAG: hypothetical protein IJX28_08840 [Clostridia bacterium]|nr:hypothetical protein [Clostridia bacterium]